MRRWQRWKGGPSRACNKERTRLNRVGRRRRRRGGQSRARNRCRGRRGSTSGSSGSLARKGSTRNSPWRMGLPVGARPARHLPPPSSIHYPSSIIRPRSNATLSPSKIDSNLTWPIRSSSSLNCIPSSTDRGISSKIRSTGKNWQRPIRGASSMSLSFQGYQEEAARASWSQLWTARHIRQTAMSNST